MCSKSSKVGIAMSGYENLKIKRNDLYIFLIGLVAFQDALNSSTLFKPLFEAIKYPLLGTILLLMAYLILNARERIVSWMIFAAFLVLGIYTSSVLSTNAILYIVVLAFLSRKKDMVKPAKVVLCIIGSKFLLHLGVFLFNYLFSKDSLQYLSWNGLNRYYLYYDHPNNAAKYFVFIITLIVYLYTERLKVYHWLGVFASMLLVYSFTHSEAVFITVFLFFISFFSKSSWMNTSINFFSKYGMVIISAISVCFAFAIKIPFISNVIMLLDDMGSGRFSNMFRAVQQYGITILGQKVIFGSFQQIGGYESIYADNLTVYCLTCLGLIYVLILCILFLRAEKGLDINGKIYVSMFILFSLFENRVFGIEAYFAVALAANALAIKNEPRDKLPYCSTINTL